MKTYQDLLKVLWDLEAEWAEKDSHLKYKEVIDYNIHKRLHVLGRIIQQLINDNNKNVINTLRYLNPDFHILKRISHSSYVLFFRVSTLITLNRYN